MDGSNNVGPATFALLIKFIKAIYHTLPVSGKGVHIGMVTFGDQGNMVFNFRQHRTISDLDLAVDQLQLPGGSGNKAGAGLTVAHTQVFSGSGRKHKMVKKAVVTILVGKSDDDVAVPIKKIKSEDIISIIIGINSYSGEAKLIASSPDHQLLLTDPRQLMDFIDKVIEMLNKGKQRNLFRSITKLTNCFLCSFVPCNILSIMDYETYDFFPFFSNTWWACS